MPPEWDGALPEPKPFLFSSEPIIGYRCFGWSAADDIGVLFDLLAKAPADENPYAWARKPRLHSVAYGDVWPELHPMEAECGAGGRHRPPGKGCSCGLWVVKDKDQARRYAGQYSASIVAEVAIWGRFVEHAGGWRGEFAYPQRIFVLEPALLDPHGWKHEEFVAWAEEVGGLYGIPAEVWKAEPRKPEKPKGRKLGRTNPGTGRAWSAQIVTNIAAPAPPSVYPWPASIVHPSQLYPTIVLPAQVAIYRHDLPF